VKKAEDFVKITGIPPPTFLLIALTSTNMKSALAVQQAK